jgi:hypothetical protein
MSRSGDLLIRGMESGSQIGPISGQPQDVEIVNGQAVVLLTNGTVLPEGTLTDDGVGSEIVEAIDIEAIGTTGYLILDRKGGVRAYGTAVYQSDLVREQQVRLGRNTFTVDIPAVDLEVVPDPARPGVNLGYYVTYIDGFIAEFGAVPPLDPVFMPTGNSVAALSLTVDAAGTLGYVAMDTYGRFYSSSTGRLPGPALRDHPESPVAVDFAQLGDGFVAVNEVGVVYMISAGGSVTVLPNAPVDYARLIGNKGFIDIEVGLLAQ